MRNHEFVFKKICKIANFEVPPRFWKFEICKIVKLFNLQILDCENFKFAISRICKLNNFNKFWNLDFTNFKFAISRICKLNNFNEFKINDFANFKFAKSRWYFEIRDFTNFVSKNSQNREFIFTNSWFREFSNSRNHEFLFFRVILLKILSGYNLTLSTFRVVTVTISKIPVYKVWQFNEKSAYNPTIFF